MKRVLVIKAHPKEASFCNSLVEKYIEGARANKAKIKILDLGDLKLEPCLKYDDSMPAADGLERPKELTAWGDHSAFTCPANWSVPLARPGSSPCGDE